MVWKLALGGSSVRTMIVFGLEHTYLVLVKPSWPHSFHPAHDLIPCSLSWYLHTIQQYINSVSNVSYVDYSVTKGRVSCLVGNSDCFKQSSILMLEKSQELRLVLGERSGKVCTGPWVLGKAQTSYNQRRLRFLHWWALLAVWTGCLHWCQHASSVHALWHLGHLQIVLLVWEEKCS